MRNDTSVFLKQAEEFLSDLKGRQKMLEAGISEARQIIRQNEQHMEQKETLQKALQIVASALQMKAHNKVSTIVTKCLNTIFDDPYEFQIKFEQKRNKTEATAIFLRDGKELSDPLSASGGGAIDVAAFALRLAAIVLSRPKKRKLMILDEPFKYVSQKYRSRIGELLTELCEGYGVQLIMVTHIDELKVGTVCRLG